MIAIKIFLLFIAIMSLVSLLEQLYLIAIALKNKANVKDDGFSRMVLSIVLSISVALLIAFWDKF